MDHVRRKDIHLCSPIDSVSASSVLFYTVEMDIRAKDRVVSLQFGEQGRATIPFRIRQYHEFSDLKQNDIWIGVTIHGFDSDKPPELTGDDG